MATYPRVPHGPQRGSSSEVRGRSAHTPPPAAARCAPAATAPVARPAAWPSLGPAPTAPARRSSRSAGSSRPGWRGRAGSGVAGSGSGRARHRTGSPGRSSQWPCRTARPPASRRHSLEGIVDRLRDQGHEPLVMSRRPTADRPQPMRSVRWSGLTERRLILTRLRGQRVHGSGTRSDPSPSQEGTAIMTRTTNEVIDRSNQAFQERDATLLEDIIAPDCVMEGVQPAPTAPATRAMTRRSARGRRSSTTPPATSRSRTSTPATSGRSSAGATSGAPAPTTRSVASTSCGSSTARSSRPPATRRPRR
jgi:hypothetical protein